MSRSHAAIASQAPATGSHAGARLRGRIGEWLFRRRGPEPSPIVLTHKRIYVLPTRPGLFFGLALAAMLIGAINYQLSLGFALT
ncbi:MAG: hypothetical protein JNM37_09400, partial [Rhodocyclaceae bacterium]|nr:hypothetical protein [Rhodocyclaceae bacterium]